MCTDIYLKHFYIKSFLNFNKIQEYTQNLFLDAAINVKNNFRNFCCCFAKWFAKFIRNVKNSIKSYGM